MNLGLVIIALFLLTAIFLYCVNFELERKINFKVNRNIQEIFSYMSNPDNNKDWLSGVIKIKKNTPGEINIGTVFEFQRKVAGRIVEGTIKIIKFDANKQYCYKSITGNYSFKFNYTFEKADANETHVIFNAFWKPTRFFDKLMGSLVFDKVKRQFEVDFIKLKEVLENKA
jgi:carbon monoxide dehydrogenase subunit G